MFVFNKVEIHSSQGIGNNCAGTFDKIHRKTPAMDSFLVTHRLKPTTLLKSISMTRVFLRIMQKVFQKSFFKEQATNCFSRYFTMNALFCMRIKAVPMHKKCPCLELFWSIFFRIRTEYEDLLSKSPYSV